MTDIYPVDDRVRARALIDAAGHEKTYARSVEVSEAPWTDPAVVDDLIENRQNRA